MLKRALNSINNQTLRDFEVIVINDGENFIIDDLISFEADFDLRYVCNEDNKGAGESRNVGIKMARGCFICFLDDDDEYKPEFLANTANVIEKYGDEFSFSWSNVELKCYSENGTEYYFRERFFKEKYISNELLFAELLSIGTGFGITIKKECLFVIGLFNKNLRVVEDTDLFIRLLSYGYVPRLVPSNNILIHDHHESRLTSTETEQVRIDEALFLLREHKVFFYKYPILRRQLEFHIETLQQAG